MEAPVFTIGSGPTGGVISSLMWGKELGYSNIVTTDVGGTSFDVSLIIEGETIRTEEAVLNQYRLRLPMVNVISIGAGGGSVGWIDPTMNTLKVGPQSMGADPGPACYDKGGQQATLVDSDVILGYLNPDYYLDGKMKLNKDRSWKAVKELADKLRDGHSRDCEGNEEDRMLQYGRFDPKRNNVQRIRPADLCRFPLRRRRTRIRCGIHQVLRTEDGDIVIQGIDLLRLRDRVFGYHLYESNKRPPLHACESGKNRGGAFDRLEKSLLSEVLKWDAQGRAGAQDPQLRLSRRMPACVSRSLPRCARISTLSKPRTRRAPTKCCRNMNRMFCFWT